MINKIKTNCKTVSEESSMFVRKTQHTNCVKDANCHVSLI